MHHLSSSQIPKRYRNIIRDSYEKKAISVRIEQLSAISLVAKLMAVVLSNPLYNKGNIEVLHY